MIRFFSLFLLVICNNNSLFAQQAMYKVADIPANLIENANSVKRYEKVEFIVQGINRAEKKVHRVVTVLNTSAASELVFAQYTDKFTSLESAEIKIYNRDGIVIEKFSKKDFRAESSSDGLVEDGKMFYIQLPAAAYPLTAEFKYETRLKGTLFYPDFEVQGPDESVEISQFVVSVPVSLGLRYKSNHISVNPAITEAKETKTFSWEFKSRTAIKDEVGATHYRNRFPAIQTAPNKFELAGYEGDFTSWKNFGLWMNQLNKGRDDFNADKKAFFNELVKDVFSDSEKVNIIYHYLQQNFRYVSIQLGIGGFQPFPASFTDKKKYGDCKALSNYMKAALSAVGIRSHLAIINAAYNGEPVDPSFPANRFNHMILCVPQEKDSLWLECTSATADFNSLGSFTENRNALLMTEDGGVLVSTPKSISSNNRFSSHTSIRIQPDGSGESKTTINAKGEFKAIVDYLVNINNSKKVEYLVKHWEFKMPDVFEFVSNADSSSGFELKTVIRKVPDFSTGSKMFLSPRIYSIAEQSLPENTDRRLDYYFHFPFVKIDTTVFFIPEGYEVEALPTNRLIINELGKFYTTAYFDKEKSAVTTTANFELYNNRIPAKMYNACREFLSAVIKEFTDKIILKKV